MNLVNQAGYFRGSIIDYALQKSDSSESVGIAIVAHLTEIYADGLWEDWSQYEIEARGTLWIIKKDGSVNTSQVNTLATVGGWDGTIEVIENKGWQPEPMQFTVGEEEYKGQKRYKISFINAYHRTPGASTGNVDGEKAKEIKTRFGGALRAAVANAKRAAGGTAGAPPVPRPKPTPTVKPSEAVVPTGIYDDEIPY